jgi:hypothetical protein
MLDGLENGRFSRALLPWVLPLLLLSCKSSKNDSGPDAQVGEQVPTVEDLDPRALDILFMVDNSPSMDPKQGALAAAFSNMLGELRKIPAGLPDLHIGVVSSDMCAGGGEAAGGGCVALGNQGILWGNDPSVDPGLMNNKYATIKHITGMYGAPGCGMSSGARWIEDAPGTAADRRWQNYQGDLTEVVSCLVKAAGVNGYGYEHQLQSVRVALNPTEEINPQNFGFLRPKAYLAIVLVSDEDDCSADPNNEFNDGMFSHRMLGETSSLRCASRGHVCNGQDIPNYDPPLGYTGSEPFVARFADCDAKDDTGSPRNYKKLPLFRVRDIIDGVRQVKKWPSEQIMAAGIIGWPEGSLDGVEYCIDRDLTAEPVEQRKLWDYMPICSVADRKSADGNIYKAYGGLRLKKFLDAFKKPNETNVFSVCNPDFSEAMTQIGRLMVSRLGG